MEKNNKNEKSKNGTKITKNKIHVACCDTAYAKSQQGLFKLGMIILSFITWVTLAFTPYYKVILTFETYF